MIVDAGWVKVDRRCVTVTVDPGSVVVLRMVLVTREVSVVVIVLVGAARALAASSSVRSAKRMLSTARGGQA